MHGMAMKWFSRGGMLIRARTWQVAFLATIGTRPLTSPYGAGESRSLTTDDLGLLHRRSKEFRITNTVEVSGECQPRRLPVHPLGLT